jgi:hypothetical protein
MKKFYVKLQQPTVEMVVRSSKDCSGETSWVSVVFKRYEAADSDTKYDLFNGLIQNTDIEAVKKHIKSEIVALKNVVLDSLDDDGLVTEYHIADTRVVEDQPELWGAKEKCLDFLLDMYLSSTPWSSSLTKALFSVYINMDLSAEAKLGN